MADLGFVVATICLYLVFFAENWRVRLASAGVLGLCFLVFLFDAVFWYGSLGPLLGLSVYFCIAAYISEMCRGIEKW